MTVTEQRKLDEARQMLELLADDAFQNDTIVITNKARRVLRIAQVLARQVGNNSLITAIETAEGEFHI